MRLPLEGIRVLDMTVVWAGPYSTMQLGDMGAEVIRVENTQFFQASSRGNMARPKKEVVQKMGFLGGCYPDLDPGEHPWNRNAIFNSHSRNKLSVTVDVRKPEGKEIFKQLVAISDVLVENNAAGVLDRLGLGYEELAKVNPRFIMVSASGMGATGPYSHFHGWGNHFEDLSGHTWLRGYADSDPSTTTGSVLSDAAAGAGIAIAVLMALHYRNRTGKGQYIDMSQSENLVPYFGEAVMDYVLNGNIQGTLGNRSPREAPQGAYRCAGDDNWIAITVADDEEWQALCRYMGRNDLAADEGLANVAGRQARHDELDAIINAFTRDKDHIELFHELQRAGVTAGAILNEREAYADPQLRSRDFFFRIEHPEAGTHDYPGPLWKMSKTPVKAPPRHPPLLGQDNEYVYKTLLKVSDEEYARLEAEGHIGTAYAAHIP